MPHILPRTDPRRRTGTASVRAGTRLSPAQPRRGSSSGKGRPFRTAASRTCAAKASPTALAVRATASRRGRPSGRSVTTGAPSSTTSRRRSAGHVLDTLAGAPRTEQRHGHHRCGRVHGQPRDPSPDAGDVAPPPVALGEDPHDPAPPQHPQCRLECRATGLAVHRDLTGGSQDRPQRAAEHLLLDQDVRTAAARPRAAPGRRSPRGGSARGSRVRSAAGARLRPAARPTPRGRGTVRSPGTTPGPRSVARVPPGARPVTDPPTASTSPSTASTVSSMPRPDESTVVTPSAAVRNSTTVESVSSRPTTSWRVAAIAAASAVPCRSVARRASRASSLAVRSRRTSASGAITVVMSRPSTTIPLPSLKPTGHALGVDHAALPGAELGPGGQVGRHLGHHGARSPRSGSPHRRPCSPTADGGRRRVETHRRAAWTRSPRRPRPRRRGRRPGRGTTTPPPGTSHRCRGTPGRGAARPTGATVDFPEPDGPSMATTTPVLALTRPPATHVP